jgi:hypothetical protein
MKYSVDRYPKTGESINIAWDMSKKAATAEAKRAAGEYPNDKIYVSWHRSTDGQHGYLNRDGSHAITGAAW